MVKKCLLWIGLFALISFKSLAQKNIVLIIADDLGKDYCGFYSTTTDTAKMPTIRKMADEGLVFTKAWANPVCSPTRASILTGRYGFRTGVGNAIDNTSTQNLDTSEYTLPKVLKLLQPNYKCANVGKWHVNTSSGQSIKYPVTKFGYDLYSGPFIGALSDYYNYSSIRNGVTETITTYATTQNVNDAVNWLSTIGNNPFFLWLAFNAPHTPYHKPPDSLTTYTGLTGTTAHINGNKSLYFKASIEAMDKEVSRLQTFLKATGKWDSTIFIFIGDNGTAKDVSQGVDLSRTKGTVYQYGVNVPFLFYGPTITKGTNNELVSVVDLFSTILSLGGASNYSTSIPSSKTIDSKDLTPYLFGSKPLIREYAYAEVFSTPSQTSDAFAVRNNSYKLIRWQDGTEEFYQIQLDSLETTNLLKGVLSSTEQAQYNAICNEISRLRGTSLCKNATSAIMSQKFGYKFYLQNNKLILDNIEELKSIALISLEGKEIFHSNITNPEIHLPNLLSGIYFIHFWTKKGNSWTEKLFLPSNY